MPRPIRSGAANVVDHAAEQCSPFTSQQRRSDMSVGVNGIAHIQLTVRDPERCLPFWEKLCHFLDMQTLIKGDEVLYCIGSRTGVLVRGAPAEKRGETFD